MIMHWKILDIWDWKSSSLRTKVGCPNNWPFFYTFNKLEHRKINTTFNCFIVFELWSVWPYCFIVVARHLSYLFLLICTRQVEEKKTKTPPYFSQRIMHRYDDTSCEWEGINFYHKRFASFEEKAREKKESPWRI